MASKGKRVMQEYLMKPKYYVKSEKKANDNTITITTVILIRLFLRINMGHSVCDDL